MSEPNATDEEVIVHVSYPLDMKEFVMALLMEHCVLIAIRLRGE